MFTDDLVFCEKWISIINKCSTNLMLLLIDRSTEIIEQLKTDVDKTETNVKEKYTEDEFKTKIKEAEDAIATFSGKICEFKIRKFDRDSKNYSSNRMYKFLN